MGLPSVGMGENAGPMKVVKAARVLRPLKLVSGVPSKLWLFDPNIQSAPISSRDKVNYTFF